MRDTSAKKSKKNVEHVNPSSEYPVEFQKRIASDPEFAAIAAALRERERNHLRPGDGES